MPVKDYCVLRGRKLHGPKQHCIILCKTGIILPLFLRSSRAKVPYSQSSYPTDIITGLYALRNKKQYYGTVLYCRSITMAHMTLELCVWNGFINTSKCVQSNRVTLGSSHFYTAPIKVDFSVVILVFSLCVFCIV